MYRDKLVLVSLLGSAVINILLWVLLLSKFGYSQDRLPLHFNVVYGIDFVGSSRQVYQLPAAGLTIFFVNWLLTRSIYPRLKLFGYFLTTVALAVQVILLVAIMSLIFLNR